MTKIISKTSPNPSNKERQVLRKNVYVRKGTAYPRINDRLRFWYENESGLGNYGELAALLSTPQFPVNVSNIKSIMNGIAAPNLSIIMQWHRKGGVPYEYIFEGKKRELRKG